MGCELLVRAWAFFLGHRLLLWAGEVGDHGHFHWVLAGLVWVVRIVWEVKWAGMGGFLTWDGNHNLVGGLGSWFGGVPAWVPVWPRVFCGSRGCG